MTEIARDENGLPTSVIEALGEPEASTVATLYNAFGQPLQIVNPNGNVTALAYSASGASEGYLESVTVDPGGLGLATQYETDSRGNVTAQITPRGVRHETEYNALDWEIESRQATTGSSDGAPALDYVTRLLYDRNGNVTEVQIPYEDGSQHTKVRYVRGILDELLEEKREIDPGTAESEWATTKSDYDENFNPIRATGAEGQVSEISYDPRNLVERIESGLGTNPLPAPIVETVTYNLDRQPVVRVDGRDNPWSTAYDGYGRVASSSDPLGHRQEAAYDNAGNVTASRAFDASGNLLAESAAVYDARLRPTESHRWLWTGIAGAVRPGGAQLLISRVEYDAASNVTKTVDALNREATMIYDSAERLIETVDPLANRLVLALDAVGNVTQQTAHEKDPQGGTTQVVETASFDALDRPVEIQDAFGNATSLGYDARSLERRVTDAEGFETLYTYDGLNRRTFEQMPEGITIAREYDKSSRLLAYVDALSNRTSWTYDALDRTTSMTYPDATAETYEHDAANNLVRRVDQRGTEIVQSFDLANRLTGRTATPTAGEIVEGPFTESYVYDGLDRLLQGQSGTVVTDFTYDSLSRRVSETTLGRTVTYDYDEVSNPVRLGYPSGVVIGQQFDALDRPSRIGPTAGEIVDRASYGYRGPHLLQEKRSGAGLSKTWQYDAARRPVRAHTASPAMDAYPVFDERLSWSPRNLKVATYRQDLGGKGFELSQDGAHRLRHAALEASSANGVPNNSVPLGLGSAPHRRSYEYDAAQNLVSRQEVDEQASSTTLLPPDASGRNRPGSIGNVTLEYDANGNLKRKGSLRFYYDFRNRLSRVTDDQGIEVATYEYDVFNRRVKAHQPAAGSDPAQTTETVWSGWRELEQYRNGVLHQRFTRGVGIDEIVRIEADQDLNGQLDADLVPHYDETGNLVLLTGLDDEIVAEYRYSPFGRDVTPRVDAVPPEVEQVIVKPDRIELELSEGHVLPDDLGVTGRIELLPLSLPNTAGSVVTKNAPIAIEVSQPVQEGRTARRRLVIRPTTTPTAGEQAQLTLQPDAVRDLFLNPMSAVFQTTVTWPASGSEVVSDTADPEVEELRLQDGHLELIFSEPPDLASASGAVKVDGASLSWTLEPDGYTLRSVDPLPEGAHVVTVTAGAALDRAGQGVVAEFSESITVTAGVENEEYFAKGDPREIGMAALVNRFAFHGRPVDLETGLVYFRNRYYDPEMGRFVTADPLGFVDGPSMYGFAGYSPGDVTDPMGLYIIAGPRELYEIREILKDLDLTDLAQSLMLTKRNGETVIGIYSGMAHRQWQDLASSLGLTKEEDGDYVFTNEDDVDSVAAMIGGVILSKFRTEVHVLDGHQVCLGQFSFWLGGYCHFGRDLIKTSGGVTKMEESGGRYRATVAVNTYLTSLVRPLGSEGTRIPMTPRAALVHELGHVWATIEKEIKSSELNLSTSGPTDVEAVIFEDHYRIKVGLPLRGSHSPATFCTGEEEIRGLSPKNCQDRLRQDFSR